MGIKNNVAAQTKAFSELADGSQCHLENQSQVNLAVAKSKQAEGTLAAAAAALTTANSASVDFKAPFSSLTEGECSALFESQSYVAAKAASKAAAVEVTKATEAKNFADKDVTLQTSLAAQQKAACLCKAQQGHAAMVANVAAASAGDDRLYTVSEQILCTINKDDCKKSATPKAVVKPLVETAIKAECKR